MTLLKITFMPSDVNSEAFSWKDDDRAVRVVLTVIASPSVGNSADSGGEEVGLVESKLLVICVIYPAATSRLFIRTRKETMMASGGS